jgi:hypothetical protein
MEKKHEFCVWCEAKVKLPHKGINPKKKIVCSKGCRDAEMLFTKMFSDESINRRAHYTVLTKGDGYGQD